MMPERNRRGNNNPIINHHPFFFHQSNQQLFITLYYYIIIIIILLFITDYIIIDLLHISINNQLREVKNYITVMSIDKNKKRPNVA